jgi:hypothetical protein
MRFLTMAGRASFSQFRPPVQISWDAFLSDDSGAGYSEFYTVVRPGSPQARNELA